MLLFASRGRIFSSFKMQTIKIFLTLLVTGSIYYGNSTCGGRAHKHDDFPSSQPASQPGSHNKGFCDYERRHRHIIVWGKFRSEPVWIFKQRLLRVVPLAPRSDRYTYPQVLNVHPWQSDWLKSEEVEKERSTVVMDRQESFLGILI